MINFFKKQIPEKTRLKFKYKLRYLSAILYPYNLSKIARIHKTDKFGFHFYTPHYQKHFRSYKFKKNNILEIGVGGYNDPYRGGNSLRMWKNYFPFSKIYSLDIYDKSFLEERRIKIFKGSQVDISFLDKLTSETGDFDLIIDDGSHINEHVVTSFKFLFPKLKKGGIYVVEDTQTSYWEEYGGDSNDFDSKNTIYGYFYYILNLYFFYFELK